MGNNITIVRAENSLLPQLINVWQVCFGDEEAYIRLYYTCNFDRSENYAILDGIKVIGILHLIPAEIDDRKAYYGYAMGILPEYRGKGVFIKLQEHAFNFVKEQNAGYFLKPANEKLESYYYTQGFMQGYYLKKYSVPAGHSCSIKAVDIEADEYKEMRDTYFTRPGYVKWDLHFINYAIIENRNSGGIVKKVITDSGIYSIFASLKENELIIRETTIPDNLLQNICSELTYKNNTKRAIIELPVYTDIKATDTHSVGMLFNMEATGSAYFNLPLD